MLPQSYMNMFCSYSPRCFGGSAEYKEKNSRAAPYQCVILRNNALVLQNQFTVYAVQKEGESLKLQNQFTAYAVQKDGEKLEGCL